MRNFYIILFCIFGFGAQADELKTALEQAQLAYERGDMSAAAKEISLAQNLIMGVQAEELSKLLPEAPEGWEREVSLDSEEDILPFMMGVSASAFYYRDSQEVELFFSIGGFLDPEIQLFLKAANRAIPPGADVIRISGEHFTSEDGEIYGYVGNNVFVSLSGDPESAALKILESIDLEALSAFGG